MAKMRMVASVLLSTLASQVLGYAWFHPTINLRSYWAQYVQQFADQKEFMLPPSGEALVFRHLLAIVYSAAQAWVIYTILDRMSVSFSRGVFLMGLMWTFVFFLPAWGSFGFVDRVSSYAWKDTLMFEAGFLLLNVLITSAIGGALRERRARPLLIHKPVTQSTSATSGYATLAGVGEAPQPKADLVHERATLATAKKLE